jgi:hypothetical protein
MNALRDASLSSAIARRSSPQHRGRAIFHFKYASELRRAGILLSTGLH